MSHIATVKAKAKDLDLFEQACAQHGVRLMRGVARHQLYSDTVEGVAYITLPGSWRYPVVIQKDGSLKFDNYNGKWGDPKYLHRILQTYSRKVVMKQAQRMGMTARAQVGKDGSLVMTLVGR